MALRSLALCAGIGGLDLGIRLARPDHRLVGVVERQAYCAAVLVARMEEQALDPAPIWDDLATFDAEAWRGAVDLVTAGFPCQPVSVAGDRAGQDDERWLWPQVWRVVRGVGARYLFVENVPGLLSLGLGDVLGDLAACGWAAEWDCVPAASVGAPHLRDRLFLLAADASRHGERDARQPQSERRRGGSSAAHDDGGHRTASDADRERRAQRRAERDAEGSTTVRGAADADSARREGADDARQGQGCWHVAGDGTAADPDSDRRAARRRPEEGGRSIAHVADTRGAHGRTRLSPRFVEWMMGLPTNWTAIGPIASTHSETQSSRKQPLERGASSGSDSMDDDQEEVA